MNADRAGLLCALDFSASVRAFMLRSAGPADRFGSYDPSDFLARGVFAEIEATVGRG